MTVPVASLETLTETVDRIRSLSPELRILLHCAGDVEDANGEFFVYKLQRACPRTK